MKNHVTGEILEWLGGTSSRREEIDKHLKECLACRKYYKRMADILLPGAGIQREPRLAPDPHLPTRIAALASERSNRVRRGYLLRWSFACFAVLIGGVIGMVLGKGLSQHSAQTTINEQGIFQSQQATQDIGNVYYDALSQQDFSVRLDSLARASEGIIE